MALAAGQAEWTSSSQALGRAVASMAEKGDTTCCRYAGDVNLHTVEAACLSDALQAQDLAA